MRLCCWAGNSGIYTSGHPSLSHIRLSTECRYRNVQVLLPIYHHRPISTYEGGLVFANFLHNRK